jgi:hypothetical protein
LAAEGDERERVEELVVAEDAGCWIGSAADVDEWAGGVGDAAGCQ